MSEQAAALSPTVPSMPGPEDGGHALRGWMRRMREEHPVLRDANGTYQVFRYDDVQRVLSDFRVFSSDRSRMMPVNGQIGRGNLTMMDPPEHRRFRQLASQAFTPRIVSRLEPRIVATANALLDQVDGARFDLVQALAHPLPVIIIAELLGIPDADRDAFRAWSAGFGRGEGAALLEMNDYLTATSRQRRTRPRDDLISQFVTAEVDGSRLDDGEVAALCGLLLLAGHITTTVLIGNAVLCLEENPGTARRLPEEPALIPSTIEEVLRYRPPFTQATRVTVAETDIAGHPIPAGSVVTAWLLSANHDERAFPDPERFDIERKPNRQVAFGHGIHFCLGAPLARLEGRIALELLVQRFPRLRLAPGADLAFHGHPTCAVKRLPVTASD